MARIPYAEPGELTEEARQALDDLPAHLNVFWMMANAPTLVGPGIELGRALLARTELDPVDRELAILWVARRTGAQYEWAQHEPIARGAGATEQQLAAVTAFDARANCFSPVQCLTLRTADKVVTGADIDTEDIAELVSALGRRRTVELLLLPGYYTMLARFMTALDIDIDPAGDKVAGVIRMGDG